MKSENLGGWPRVVADDVIRQAHKLKNEMFVMGGKIKGKTLLPLPERIEMLYSASDMFDRWVLLNICQCIYIFYFVQELVSYTGPIYFHLLKSSRL